MLYSFANAIAPPRSNIKQELSTFHQDPVS